MSNPFLSQISIMGFNFAPKGYAYCNGQLVPVADNQALFSLIGIDFGGDGRTTLGLPDLRGRVPMHMGVQGSNYYTRGGKYGSESITLSTEEMGAHFHYLQASNQQQGATAVGKDKSFAPSTLPTYAPPSQLTPLNDLANTGAAGGSNTGQTLSHTNMQPSSVLNFVIAMTGVYPSRN